MKKEYLQPIIEIEEFDDVILCANGVADAPSPYVKDDFPEFEFD